MELPPEYTPLAQVLKDETHKEPNKEPKKEREAISVSSISRIRTKSAKKEKTSDYEQ